MDNVTIRKANMDDLESILILFDKLSLSDLPYDKDVDVYWSHTKQGKKYFTDKILKNNNICMVAEINKKTVGYFTATIKDVPGYRLVKVADLLNLVVEEQYRNLGIGKKLIDAFFEWAKNMGVNKVSVNVFSGNEKAIKFYNRCGFTSFEQTLEKDIK